MMYHVLHIATLDLFQFTNLNKLPIETSWLDTRFSASDCEPMQFFVRDVSFKSRNYKMSITGEQEN